MLPIERSDAVYHYYTSCIGAVIGIIVILFTLSHSVYHYILIFYGKNKRKPNRTNYILFFIFCIVALVPSIQYAFIRTNLLTKQVPESFTTFQCAFGFFALWSSLPIINALAYGILAYRIQIALKDSFFRYPNYVYLSLHIFLVIITIILLIIIWIPYSNTNYILYYFDSTDNVYCGSITNPDHDDKHLTYIYKIGNVIFVISQVLCDLILLYMFTYRLYTLQSELVDQHISEQTNPIHHNQHIENYSISTANIAMTSIIDNNEISNKPKLTVEDVEDKAKHNRSAELILFLHHLIKQHTILMLFIVIISIAYILTLIFGSGWFVTQLIWAINVNIICIWLMFASSNKYWQFTTKYCCCHLCYCYNKRDINATTCLLFC